MPYIYKLNLQIPHCTPIEYFWNNKLPLLQGIIPKKKIGWYVSFVRLKHNSQAVAVVVVKNKENFNMIKFLHHHWTDAK